MDRTKIRNSELKYKKNQLIALIKVYYDTFRNIKLDKVTIKTEKGYTGYGMSEQEAAITTVIIFRKIVTAGIETIEKQELSLDEIQNILKLLLREYKIEVDSVAFDDGLRSKSEGYGMNESTSHTPYCNGVLVRVKKE